MNFLRKFRPSFLFILIIVFLIAIFVSTLATQAAVILTPAGTIDSSNKTARFYDDNANLVNFKPSYLDGGNTVATHIGATELTGYAWGNTIGWVNLNSRNCDINGDGTLGDAGAFSFCPGSGSIASFKVSKDTSGRLSGYAWSENGGWINFGAPAPSTAFLSGTAPVTINATTGNWSGFAWVENYGWLQFDCSVANGCVKEVISATGTGGGGTPQINGECGSANGGTFSSAPTGLCKAGTPSPEALSDKGPWTWQCLGINRGFDQTCSAKYSPSAPLPPTICEDTTADNFGGVLPCIFKLSPPTELCIIGTNCEPQSPILSPTDLCIIGTNCESPVLSKPERPSLLCILGFSCEPKNSQPISPILPIPERPSLLCILGFSCEPKISQPISPPGSLCVEGVNCPIN